LKVRPQSGFLDGDGKTDVSIYHIPTNQWFVKGVGNLGQFGWGGADCIPVPGDYNGDGKTDILWRNKSTGQNIVWLMNGTTLGSYVELMQVTDINWQIVAPK
jgi:hypothetical protein